MTVSHYHDLALEWRPQSSSDRQFLIIAGIVLVLMLGLGLLISAIPVPEPERQVRQPIPERIANLLLEKKKQQPVIEPPKPIEKPRPEAEPKPKPPAPEPPKVRKTEVEKKPLTPLTDEEAKARAEAEQTGLLALRDQLSDLMDTSDISAMVGAGVNAGTIAPVAPAGGGRELLLADAGKTSGGVDKDAAIFKSKVVSPTQLAAAKQTQVKQNLVDDRKLARAAASSTQSDGQRAGVRAEEDVTLVFDRHKGALFSLYNRARRTNPGLKGKIILKITIAPSGKVTKLEVVTSELGDQQLEDRLVRRIRNFDFGAMNVEPVTVTYPIEFLPS